MWASVVAALCRVVLPHQEDMVLAGLHLLHAQVCLVLCIRGCLALVVLGSSLVWDRWKLRFLWAMALVPMETALQPASEYMAECGRTCRHSLQLPETV